MADKDCMPTGAAHPAPTDPRAWLSPPKPIRKVKRAVAIARVSGWTLAVFAFLSWVIAVFSWTSAVVALPLTLLAINELRGAARLNRLDERAPGILALNQLGLIVLVIAYCGWQIIAALGTTVQVPPELRNTGNPEVDQMVAELAEMQRPFTKPLITIIIIGLYAVVAALTAPLCGLHAWYYRSRRHWVRAALALPTPAGPAPAHQPAQHLEPHATHALTAPAEPRLLDRIGPHCNQ